jgi:hypothetical protein
MRVRGRTDGQTVARSLSGAREYKICVDRPTSKLIEGLEQAGLLVFNSFISEEISDGRWEG